MAKYQELAIDKFTEGMIDEDQLSRISFPEGSCVEAENVLFMPTGALKKREGYSQMNTTAWASASSITRVYSYTTTGDPGVDYALTFSCSSTLGCACIASVQTCGVGGDVAQFNEIQIDPASAASSWYPLADDPISVTTYGGSAIMTYDSNADGVFIWPATDATANIALETNSPSGASLVQAWGTYLFLGNILEFPGAATRKSSRIQWNQAYSMATWPADQFIDLDPDDGDMVTAMCVYQNKLVVWKKYKMFQIHYVGGNAMFQEERISDSIGCLGPNAWMDNGGVLYFIGAYTAYKWSGSGEPEAISDKIQGQWDAMNIEKGKIFDVDSDDSNWQIWFNLAVSDATTKNMIFAYDPRFKNWTRYTLSASCLGGIDFGKTESYADRPSAYSIYNERIKDSAASKEGVLVLGGEGILYRYGLVQTDNGTAIDGYWRSRWYDFGLPHSNKRLLRATAFVERETGSTTLHTDVYINWNTETPATQQTAALSGAVDYPMTEQRIDFTRQFRSIQFKIYTDGIDEPFTLHRLLIDWVPKGKTMVLAAAGG